MTFTPDPQGIAEVCVGFEPALKAIAAGIVEEARRGPRNPRHRKHEVDDIEVGAFRVTAKGAEQDIRWDNPMWHLVELGSVNNPPYRSLTRAAQNAGLTVDDRGPH